MDFNECATVRVSHWGESPTHWALLVQYPQEQKEITSFSVKEWFPKNLCLLEKFRPNPEKLRKDYLTAPRSMLVNFNIPHDRIFYEYITDCEFDGVDEKDYPDFADAYIKRCLYFGREANDRELTYINESGFVNEKLLER